MHKCEHGKTIIKFCMFEHCQSKQTGGCEDCIRKYHNHIGQISFLNQDDIKSIVKKFQIEANYRPKSRSLQECIFNFFTHVKSNIFLNLDLACKNLINKIGYPYLQKNGTLNCYKRLKNKQYRKVTQKELKELWEVFKVADYDRIVKEEKSIYDQAVVQMEETIDKLEKNIKEIFQDLSSMVPVTRSNSALYDRSFYAKINEVFKEIKKYPDINFPARTQPKEERRQNSKVTESPTRQKKLNRDSRDVSLDRHFKVQNKLKTQPLSAKQDEAIISPHKDKEKKTQSSQKPESQASQKERDKGGRKVPKYSFQMKPDELIIKPNKLEAGSNYSEKEEEINERKRKLMQLMNSKSIKREQVANSKNPILTPVRDKTQSNRIQVGDYLKDSLSPDRYLLARQYATPLNITRITKEERSITNTERSNKESISSKRAKTTYEEEDDSVTEYKKQTRNQTLMSSQTETQSLFNAKVHIPFEDAKIEEQFEIKQESVQRYIVVPEVDIIAKNILDMVNQCQSPLLMKKKEIENFSAFMKLAESKILEQQEEDSPKNNKQKYDQEKSFVKINRILEDSDAKTSNQVQVAKAAQSRETKNHNKTSQEQKSPQGLISSGKKQNDSVQMNENEQMSLALLLKSLKLPGAQAIPYLQKAIQYSSSNLSAAQYLSYLYLQIERPQDCLKLCNDILKLISSSQSNELALRLNVNKSAALNYLGRYSECITFLERCLRYRHNDILYKNLADAYYSVGILQKAIYNYEHAIIENSSNTEAHYNLAVCHYQQENYHNASIYIQKALKHQPTNEVYKEIKKYVDEKIMSNQI